MELENPWRSMQRPVLGVGQPCFFPNLGDFGILALIDRRIPFETVHSMRESSIHQGRELVCNFELSP